MSESVGGGWYRMHRGWLEHPALTGPFCRRSAWCWLIERAAFRPHDVTVAGQVVHLARGELVASQRDMAEAWGWGLASVNRFIRRLRDEGMVATIEGRGSTVISISQYETFQYVAELPSCGTPTGTQNGTVEHPVSSCDDGGKQSQSDIIGTPTGTPTGTLADPVPSSLVRRNVENEGEGSKGAAKRGEKRPTRIPADWQPDEAGIAFATERGVAHAAEVERFRAYWQGATKNATSPDWAAKWRTWVMNQQKFQAQRGSGDLFGGGGRKPYAKPDPLDWLVERKRAEAAASAGGPVIDMEGF